MPRQGHQPINVEDTGSTGEAGDFAVTTPRPVFRVADNTCSNHVQIDVSQTVQEVIGSFDDRAVEPVAPKCAGAILPAVVISRKIALEVVHEAADTNGIIAERKYVHMVGSEAVIEQRNVVKSR